MANIEKELNQMKEAVYGKDVRQSIHDAIKAGNDEIESYTAAEKGRQTAETTRKTNETARQSAEGLRQQTNAAVKTLIDSFVGDMVIASTTTPGAVKSGGDITVAADGTVSIMEALKRIYPVGKIEITYGNTNPSTYLGFGTWEQFAKGQTLIGVNTADADFNAAGKTGGEKAHKLTVSEMPSHDHSLYGSKSGNTYNIMNTGNDWQSITNDWAKENAVTPAGGNQSHNNLPPYITVYLWRRTA